MKKHRSISRRLRKWLAKRLVKILGEDIMRIFGEDAVRDYLGDDGLRRHMDELQGEECERSSVLKIDMIPMPPGSLVVDVGANVGIFTKQVRAMWPSAELHAIEADPKTFEALRENVGEDERVHVHCLAIHSDPGEIEFHAHSNSLLSSVIDLGEGADEARVIRVKAMTLDQWASAQRLEGIRMLKVDTEGNDLNVLQGADELLRSQSLSWVILEFGIDPGDERHVSINALMAKLAPYGLFLKGVGDWGVYNDWVYGNAVFEKNRVETQS